MKRLLPVALLATRLFAADPLPFGFAPPEIYLSDVGTRALRSGDFNRNGLPDLVLINNERGRIDLYLQSPPDSPRPAPVLRTDRWQPVLDDSRFQRQSLTLGGTLYDLAVGDFNGDGIDDLAVTDDQNRLLIFHGPVKSGWQPAARLNVTASQNAFRSLEWDSREKALLLLGEQDIQEVRWDPNQKDYHVGSIATAPPGGRPLGLLTADFIGNGRGDLLYSLRAPRFNLALHPRDEQGVGAVTLPLLDPPAERFVLLDHEPPRLLGLHPRSGALQEIRLISEDSARAPETLDVEMLALPGPPREMSLLWTDLDGQGHDHLLALSPGQPELLWYAPRGSGRFAPVQRQPVPAGINWMAAGRWLPDTPGTQILLHDTDSKFLGLADLDGARIRFPRAIPNDAEILGVQAWPSADGSPDRLLGIVRDNRTYLAKVWVLEQTEDGLHLAERQSIPLPFVTRDVSAPLPLGDAPALFLVPSAFESAFFLVETSEGRLDARPAAEGFSAGLLRRKRSEDFLLLPEGLPFPSRTVLLQEGTAQFLGVSNDGVVQVLDQLNLRGTGRLRGILPFADIPNAFGLIDSTRNLAEIHVRNEDGSRDYLRDLALPSVPMGDIRLHRNPDDRFTLRLGGRDAIVQIHGRLSPTRPAVSTLFETDLPENRPQMILTGDFNGDGQTDIALIDSAQSQLMEFLHFDGNRWRSAMHFQIFDTTLAVAGRRGGGSEPREALVADINRDGLDDILLLVHDRILVYIQDPVP